MALTAHSEKNAPQAVRYNSCEFPKNSTLAARPSHESHHGEEDNTK